MRRRFARADMIINRFVREAKSTNDPSSTAFWPSGRKHLAELLKEGVPLHSIQIEPGQREIENEWISQVRGRWARTRREDDITYYFVDEFDALMLKMRFG